MTCHGYDRMSSILCTTLHSTPYALHSTLHTLHSTFYTLHSIHYTLHTRYCTLLYIIHSTLYIMHYTLYRLHTIHHTLYDMHRMLHSVPQALYSNISTYDIQCSIYYMVCYAICYRDMREHRLAVPLGGTNYSANRLCFMFGRLLGRASLTPCLIEPVQGASQPVIR